MNLKRIPTPSEGNNLFPLPADYESCTIDGQREARLNACRQWLCPGDDLWRAYALTESMRFFDGYYLWPDEAEDFDPLFYDDPPIATPAFHWDIARRWAIYRATLTIAPRGSAKSFLCAKRMMLQMLSRPAYTFVYATATHDLTEVMGNRIKNQLYENARIHDDWAPSSEFGGRLKPVRGDRPTGTKHFYLTNGSGFRAISAESKQRGIRPRRYILDDPEHDPKASTSMALIREYMERLLFKIVLPSVLRADVGVDWLATFVSKRHYAYHAMENEEGPEGLHAMDPRFGFWSRTIIKAAQEGPQGKMLSCWPDMWPVTREEQREKAKSNPHFERLVSLEEARELMGARNFSTEMLQEPGESDDQFFGALTKEKHGYWYEQADEILATQPRQSTAFLCWTREGKPQRASLQEQLRTGRLFMTVDTSFTTNSDSDSKVACLMLLNSYNELFVLDLWSGKVDDPIFLKAIFDMADRWKVQSVHPEVIKGGFVLYNSLLQVVRTRMTEQFGVVHVPAIQKITGTGMMEKTTKIAALHPRFAYGLVKLPVHLKSVTPWNRLFDQIESFNPDAADGGLQHDDEIDCLGMSQFVIKGRPARALSEVQEDRGPEQRLLEGEIFDDLGFPLLDRINLDKIDPDLFWKIYKKHTQEQPDVNTPTRA